MTSSEKDFLLDSTFWALTMLRYFANENVALNSPQALDSVCLVSPPTAARPGVGWTPKRPLSASVLILPEANSLSSF